MSSKKCKGFARIHQEDNKIVLEILPFKGNPGYIDYPVEREQEAIDFIKRQNFEQIPNDTKEIFKVTVYEKPDGEKFIIKTGKNNVTSVHHDNFKAIIDKLKFICS